MADLFENPMGLDGFEFVEFASPTAGTIEPVFEMLGFTAVARHRSKNVTLYRQGDINFILNEEKDCYASFFADEHGPSACGMAFRVKDSHAAYALALKRGGQPVEIPTGPMELRLPAIKGIGGRELRGESGGGSGVSLMFNPQAFAFGPHLVALSFCFPPGPRPTPLRYVRSAWNQRAWSTGQTQQRICSKWN